VLRDIAGQAHESGESSLTYGVMYQREADRAAELEHQLPHLWHQVSSRRRRYWS
jgi:hypothetical protein